MGLLEDKVCVVTGGAGGLGATVVTAMVNEGATVVCADVADDRGHELVAALGEQASFVHLDVADEAGWKQVVPQIEAKHGPLDVLVNNAGIVALQLLANSDKGVYDRVIATNQTGTWLGMRAALGSMCPRRSGAIVNISSIDGIRGARAQTAYAASKHAVVGMTRSAALEVAPLGIRINAVAPGGMATNMLASADLSILGDFDPAAIMTMVPAQRFAEPAEIAQLVVFLASYKASYCNGSVFVADGSWTAGYGI